MIKRLAMNFIIVGRLLLSRPFGECCKLDC